MTQLTQPLCSEKEFCVNLVSTCADPVPGPIVSPALRATRQVPAVRMPAGYAIDHRARMSDEMERYTMRTAVVQDGIWMRSKCLVHADCRHHGRMCFPSGRRVDLKTKTRDIKDLNANFVSHLEKRDEADGTSHADTWRKGLIHGPRAPFTVPYDGEARASDSEVREERADMEVDAAPDPQRDTVIALAAARMAATAVANVLAAARAAEAAPAVTVPGRCHKSDLCNNVHNHRGRCNQKRKRSVVTNP